MSGKRKIKYDTCPGAAGDCPADLLGFTNASAAIKYE
jgi:hypothetical protein